MRVVELPVSSTEDRVVGTIDLEEAIKKGDKKFEPGFWLMPIEEFYILMK